MWWVSSARRRPVPHRGFLLGADGIYTASTFPDAASTAPRWHRCARRYCRTLYAGLTAFGVLSYRAPDVSPGSNTRGSSQTGSPWHHAARRGWLEHIWSAESFTGEGRQSRARKQLDRQDCNRILPSVSTLGRSSYYSAMTCRLAGELNIEDNTLVESSFFSKYQRTH